MNQIIFVDKLFIHRLVIINIKFVSINFFFQNITKLEILNFTNMENMQK